MSSIERRRDARVNVRVPLRFRRLDVLDSVEQTAESENISQRGIYFMTTLALKVGTPVEVSLRMPQALSEKSSSSNDVKALARVVRVDFDLAAGGWSGIGLHIERYEAKVSAGERWTS